MLYWSALVVLIILVVLAFNDKIGYDSEVWFVMFSIILAGVILAGVVCYMEDTSNLQSFKATKETVYQLRNKNNIDFEKATLSRDIIEANNWLARKQYWESKFWFGATIPNEVMELEKINY